MAYVYAIFTPDSTPLYIGVGNGNRVFQHTAKRCQNPILQKYLQRAEDAGVECPRVILRDNLARAEAFEIEIALIAAIGRRPHGPLANMADGGEGGPNVWTGQKHTAEAIEKIKQASTGRSHTPETRAKIAAANLGAKRTREMREAMSRSHIGKKLPVETRAKIAAANNKRYSDPAACTEQSARMTEWWRQRKEKNEATA